MLDIDQLIASHHGPSTLLCEVRDGEEIIQICEHDGLRWAYTGGRAVLSAFRPKTPAQLVFPNHRALLCPLLLCEHSDTVLNMGFGLGSFERYFCASLPDLKVVSVDCSAILLELAQRWFQIRAHWPVIVEPAHAHLCASTARFDIILADIFYRDAHAQCLYEQEFYAAAAQHLNSGSVLALNLSPTSNDDLLEILHALRANFGKVSLSTITNHANVVLLASHEAATDDDAVPHKAQCYKDTLGIDLRDELSQFRRLP